MPPPLVVRHAVADRLVYGRTRAAFGGNLCGSVSGSAAPAPDLGCFIAGPVCTPLRAMAFVSNILVIGDGRNCSFALIALDETMITSWAATQEFGHLTAKRPVVEREYAQAIDGMHEGAREA
ncbi:hypothetical protein [Streptomyces parvus]|uniref:hypothetical protein n=1 Tax=Streptomyces parvus TaxID=66428 RepID=UPI0034117C51